MNHCFKEGELSRQGREVLRSQMSIVNERDTNSFEVSGSDVEDVSDPHLWIDDDQEVDDQDVDVLFFNLLSYRVLGFSMNKRSF